MIYPHFILNTRPKLPFGPTDLLWCKKRYVTDSGVQLTPPLVQKTLRHWQLGPTDLLWCKKTLRHWHWGPTDLLWCKKRYVTDSGVQLTSFGAKNVTSMTRGSNWPFRCLDSNNYNNNFRIYQYFDQVQGDYEQNWQLTTNKVNKKCHQWRYLQVPISSWNTTDS